MSNLQNNIVAGSFKKVEEAEKSIEFLLRAGFNSSEISVLLPQDQFESLKHSTKSPVSQLSYLRYLDIPQIGAFICGGHFASILANWAVAGFSEDLKDVLVHLGLPEDGVLTYLQRIQNGSCFLYVCCEGKAKQGNAMEILKSVGVQDLTSSSVAAIETRHLTSPWSFGVGQESYRPLI